ncbi:hypothetical protein EOD42_18565 [Rhodovarius crocodyli]|uniref:Uncharacterized protein n=1 Tax=Rhodovarius crocodyli TaxID=1979269 RepID=A0A437M3E7_9PROT|nr:hypothetical protein [Rhodovarius crocodyli]RVT92220.1 hypothetical protein EOD42_18565 [Rhodovarius crocodyli]
MPERPDAPDLLATARALLLESLLPALPRERQLEARMIARAMEIAARPAPPAATVLAGATAMIRAGQADPGEPAHAALLAAIREELRARCAVSDPRAIREKTP